MGSFLYGDVSVMYLRFVVIEKVNAKLILHDCVRMVLCLFHE